MLSRERVLACLFELKEKQITFLVGEHSQVKEFLSDMMWISELAYLANIFSRLNNLNN